MIEPGLVSIVTPSLNGASFLERAIESVRDQGYGAIEHLVIDGGSTDGTLEILQRYPHLVWVSEEDAGQADAINKGFRMARGEVVAWLNTDDFYLDGAVESAVRALEAHPEVGWVYANYVQVNSGGVELRRSKPPTFDLRRQERRGNLVSSPTVFMRRAALEQAGLLDTRYHYAFDYDLWIRLGRLCPPLQLDEYWAAFRIHEGSKSAAYPAEFWREEREIMRSYRRGRGMVFPDYRVQRIRHRHPRLGLVLAKGLRAARLLLDGDISEFGRKLRRHLAPVARALARRSS